MKTKTIRVPVRGGPEMKIYWTEVEAPVLGRKKIPLEPEVPPVIEEGKSKESTLPTPPDLPTQWWQKD